MEACCGNHRAQQTHTHTSQFAVCAKEYEERESVCLMALMASPDGLVSLSKIVGWMFVFTSLLKAKQQKSVQTANVRQKLVIAQKA